MEDYSRTPQEVIGSDPAMLEYWDQLPDLVKRKLLESEASLSTLGELQLIAGQLAQQLEDPPAVF